MAGPASQVHPLRPSMPLRVLAFVEHYLPGFKAGGPVRSLSALVKALGPEFELFVFTRDRDIGDEQPYSTVPTDRWAARGFAKVYYASPGSLRWRAIRQAVRDVSPDVVYTNSAFSRMTRALLAGRQVGWLDRPLVIAPRGEWTRGALEERRWKKAVFLKAARAAGLYRGVVIQATSAEEFRAISKVAGVEARVALVPNLTDLSAFLAVGRSVDKSPGAAEFLYWSRITPKKNLALAIRALLQVRGRIKLRVAGFVDDSGYWAHCLDLASARDEGRWVEYLGPVAHEEAPQVVAAAHFMVLPTRSENFGHAILEALAAGCGVVISDRTPWTDLQSRDAGWVLPASGVEVWRDALQRCVDGGPAEFEALSRRAREFATTIHARRDPVERTRRMFFEAAGRQEGE